MKVLFELEEKETLTFQQLEIAAKAFFENVNGNRIIINTDGEFISMEEQK